MSAEADNQHTMLAALRSFAASPADGRLRVVPWEERAPAGARCDTPEEAHERMDELEEMLARVNIAEGKPAYYPNGNMGDCADHEHLFFPGIYVRIMHMHAGKVATSLMHAVEHPFVILKGDVVVWDGLDGPRILRAPYVGRTLPGTRRVVMALTEITWVTFHQTDKTDIGDIKDEITLLRTNPRLPALGDERPAAPAALEQADEHQDKGDL